MNSHVNSSSNTATIEVHTDPTSGHNYYINTVTGESTWTDPRVPAHVTSHAAAGETHTNTTLPNDISMDISSWGRHGQSPLGSSGGAAAAQGVSYLEIEEHHHAAVANHAAAAKSSRHRHGNIEKKVHATNMETLKAMESGSARNTLERKEVLRHKEALEHAEEKDQKAIREAIYSDNGFWYCKRVFEISGENNHSDVPLSKSLLVCPECKWARPGPWRCPRCYYLNEEHNKNFYGCEVCAVKRNGNEAQYCSGFQFLNLYFDEWIDYRALNMQKGMNGTFCLSLSDCRIRVNDDMEEAKSPISKGITAVGICSTFITIVSMIGTIVCLLLQYYGFNDDISLTQGSPFPIFLEDTCVCNGKLCPEVLFTFTPPKEQLETLFGVSVSDRSSNNYFSAWNATMYQNVEVQSDMSSSGGSGSSHNRNHTNSGSSQNRNHTNSSTCAEGAAANSTLVCAYDKVPVTDANCYDMVCVADDFKLSTGNCCEILSTTITSSSEDLSTDCYCDQDDAETAVSSTNTNTCPCRGNLPPVLVLKSPRLGFAHKDLADKLCWTVTDNSYSYWFEGKKRYASNIPHTFNYIQGNVLIYLVTFGILLVFQEIINFAPAGHQCSKLKVKDRLCIRGWGSCCTGFVCDEDSGGLISSLYGNFFGEVFYYLFFVAGFNVCLAMLISLGPEIFNDSEYQGAMLWEFAGDISDDRTTLDTWMYFVLGLLLISSMLHSLGCLCKERKLPPVKSVQEGKKRIEHINGQCRNKHETCFCVIYMIRFAYYAALVVCFIGLTVHLAERQLHLYPISLIVPTITFPNNLSMMLTCSFSFSMGISRVLSSIFNGGANYSRKLARLATKKMKKMKSIKAQELLDSENYKTESSSSTDEVKGAAKEKAEQKVTKVADETVVEQKQEEDVISHDDDDGYVYPEDISSWGRGNNNTKIVPVERS